MLSILEHSAKFSDYYYYYYFFYFLGPTSTKPQAEILKLNNVNGCNDISFGDHSILEGDRIPPLNSHGYFCLDLWLLKPKASSTDFKLFFSVVNNYRREYPHYPLLSLSSFIITCLMSTLRHIRQCRQSFSNGLSLRILLTTYRTCFAHRFFTFVILCLH